MTDTAIRQAIETVPVEEFIGFAQSLASLSLPAAMQQLTQFAVDHLGGADAAGLTVATTNGLATVAATSDLSTRVDALQYAYGGPCVDTLTGADPIQHVTNLATDPRWRPFARAALDQTPVRGVLSVRLSVADDPPIACLNLYATRNNAFPPGIIRAVGLYGAQAGLVLAYLQHRDNVRSLTGAIDSNRRIGAAIGIMMSRHRLTQDQAFSLLRRASQNSNRKLRDIADEVLHHGDIPQ